MNIGSFLPSFAKHTIKTAIFKLKILGKNRGIAWSSRVSLSSQLDGMTRIFANTTFHGRLGYGSYIGEHSSLSANIGRFTSVGPYVRCNPGQHPYQAPYATTAPCFFSLNKHNLQNGGTFATRQCYDEFAYFDKDQAVAIKIGNDCWIGEGAFLVGGIQIGDGAVVLAHAVVTKNVPPYAIVGGVPAKVIRYRYDEATIAFLQKIQWWNQPPSWFKQHWELLCNIDKLKQYYKAD